MTTSPVVAFSARMRCRARPGSPESMIDAKSLTVSVRAAVGLRADAREVNAECQSRRPQDRRSQRDRSAFGSRHSRVVTSATVHVRPDPLRRVDVVGEQRAGIRDGRVAAARRGEDLADERRRNAHPRFGHRRQRLVGSVGVSVRRAVVADGRCCVRSARSGAADEAISRAIRVRLAVRLEESLAQVDQVALGLAFGRAADVLDRDRRCPETDRRRGRRRSPRGSRSTRAGRCRPCARALRRRASGARRCRGGASSRSAAGRRRDRGSRGRPRCAQECTRAVGLVARYATSDVQPRAEDVRRGRAPARRWPRCCAAEKCGIVRRL